LFFDWQIRSHAQKHFIAEAKVTLIRSPALLMTLTPTQGKDMKFYAGLRSGESGGTVGVEPTSSKRPRFAPSVYKLN
jgi:hypothetical protein